MSPSIEVVGEFVVGGGSRPKCVEALLACMSGAPAFAAHPLGFLRLALGNCSHGIVYLHVWPGHDRYLQSRDLAIHQHSVTVASYVILGSLKNVLFDWVENPSGRRRLLEQNRSQTGPRLIPTDRVGDVVMRQVRSVVAGQRYSVPQEHFHETVVDWGAMVVTAAVFIGTSARPPFVTAPLRESDARTYEVSGLPEGEVDSLLAIVRRTLLDEERV